jgi:hypothetical protein
MSWAWAASIAWTISMPKPAPSAKNTANWGTADYESMAAIKAAS